MLVFCPFTINAQKHNKYSDSYNFRKGMEALDERDSKKAEESFTKEIEEHPGNGYAYLYLAHIQLHNDEYGKALSSIDNAIKYIPKLWTGRSNSSLCIRHSTRKVCFTRLRNSSESSS